MVRVQQKSRKNKGGSVEKQNESVCAFKVGKKIDSADISFEDCETLFGRPIAELFKTGMRISDKTSIMKVSKIDHRRKIVTFKSE